MPPSLCVILLQPFNMCTFLIHIHVSTCVNVPTSMGHVTTPNKCYFDFSILVSLENIILSPTDGQ